MKKLILLLFFAALFVLANNATASSLPAVQSDSLVDELLIRDYAIQQLGIRADEYQLLTTQQRANIFGRLFKWLRGLVTGYGKYQESNRRMQGPYMVFQHDNGDLHAQIISIRNKIINKQDGYFELYAHIFSKANESGTSPCYNSKCNTPIVAKCAAFVYIIGLKILNIDEIEYMPAYSSERYGYRTKAEEILLAINATGLNNFFDGSSGSNFTPFFLPSNIFATGYVFSNLINRSYELINLLAAFDMIRWQHQLDDSLGVNDNSPTINSIAESLKQSYVEPLYRRCTSGGLFAVNHANYSIICASALGSAAVVLGNWGGSMLFDWESWPRRWANVANYQIHDVMWDDPLIYFPGLKYPPGKLSKAGGTQGFAEGDHYFKLTFNALLPYMIAQYNYQNGTRTHAYYKYPMLGYDVIPSPFPKYMKTMMKDPDYDNLFRWYRNITMPNGKTPCIDESWNNVSSSGILGIKNKTLVPDEYLQTYFTPNATSMGLALETDITPDYLAAFPKVVDWGSIKSTQMMDGNTVLRNTQTFSDTVKSQHFLIALNENNIADNSVWHEQSDVGQITLNVDNDYLLIDPAKWDGAYGEELTNYGPHGQFGNHNVIYHNGDINSSKSIKSTPIMPLIDNFSIEMHGITYDDVEEENYIYEDTRNISLYKELGYWYYIVNDRCKDVKNKYCEVKFNGNSESDFTLVNKKAKWNYPCNINEGRGRWGVIAETAVTSTTATYNAYQYQHGSNLYDDGLYLQKDGKDWGYHKAYAVKSTDKENVSFVTKLTPYRCTGLDIQSTTIYNDDDYAMIKVSIGKANTTDSLRNYHMVTKVDKDSVAISPIIIKGASGFISWDDDTILKNGYCMSFTSFRKSTLNNGKHLMYDNIYTIKADDWIDAHYQLAGKYKYQGYIKANTSTNVTFYMGDVDYNYPMIAKDKLGNIIPSTHAATDPNKYKYIKLTVPEGLTEFTLELADPCMVSCFFPPTVITIDTFFDFYQGTTETLGHNLDIVKDSGELHIRDGSKVSICPNYYLFNRDSITMKSGEANPLEKFPFYAAEVDLPGGGTGITDSAYLSRYGSKRSMIIVNDLSALILDSGSYTHVGAGATIIIKKGGTLYVKKGATLEIGSQSLNGYGELIAEVGSYICIEDSSDLHFFVTSPDTNNSNMVFVPMGVNESVNQSAIQSGFSTDGRFAGAVNCLPLCSLWYYLEDYGVNNPDFGSNSLGRPVAKFALPADTLCGDIDSIIYINASASLNEVKYRITVTRPDVPDSVYFRSQNGAYGMLTNHEPINLTPLGLGAGTIKFELVVENTCGDTDYVSKTMYIPVAPTVNFELASDTICPGYGTLLADGSLSTSGMSNIKHEWTVFLIDTNSYTIGDTNQIAYGQVWQIDSSAVNNQFNFPNFRWVGGFNYLVGLKIYGNCDMVAEKWDTVAVPFQVFINSNGLNTSNPNIGNQINLQGFITTAYDSFVWYPSSLVNNPDTLMPYTTSTQDSTLYTLTAYSGSCVAVDSIWVKHNEFVNLGVDTVVCVESQMVFGNKLEPSLLVGLLAYTDYTTFATIMQDLDANVTSPADKLGLFLYDDNYNNFNQLKNTTTAFTDLITVFGYSFHSDESYHEALTYYKTHTLTQTLDYFKDDFWPNHTHLTAIIDNQISNYGGIGSFLGSVNGELINMFNQFESIYPYIATSALWYKNNTHLTGEDNWMMIKDQIHETTKYTLVVSGPGSVEYDDIMVYVDSVLTPYYSLGTMIDSVTVQFLNYTNANTFNNTTTYKWYFGDGDSSTMVNPIHQYQVKDSSYVVCLQATNRCGTYSFCDTLPLGSIQVNGFAKKGATKDPLNWQQPKPIDKRELGKLSYKNYLGYNRPNPFKETTQFDYELKPNTKDAFVKITNQLGQELRQIKLYSVKGTVELTEEGWQSGLYYYSLVVDGVVVDSKIMIIR